MARKGRRLGKRSYEKLCVPRHRVLCRQTADQIERSIEKSERREAQRVIEEQIADYPEDLSGPSVT